MALEQLSVIPVAVILRSDKQTLTSATCSRNPGADLAPGVQSRSRPLLSSAAPRGCPCLSAPVTACQGPSACSKPFPPSRLALCTLSRHVRPRVLERPGAACPCPVPLPSPGWEDGARSGAHPPARSPRKAGSLVLPSMSATSSCLPERLSSHGESCVPMNPTSRRVPAENVGPTLGTGKGMGGTESRSGTPQRLWSSQPFSATPGLGASRPLSKAARPCTPGALGVRARPPGPRALPPSILPLCLASHAPVTPVLTTGLGLLVPSFFN